MDKKNSFNLNQTHSKVKIEWSRHSEEIHYRFYKVIVTFWIFSWILTVSILFCILISNSNGLIFNCLLICFCMWLILGILAVLFLIKLFTVTPTESLILCEDNIKYTTPSKNLNLLSFNFEQNPLLNPFIIFKIKKKVELKKNLIQKIRLTQYSNNIKHLLLITDADKIEIGRELQNSEKKWLTKILKDWIEK